MRFIGGEQTLLFDRGKACWAEPFDDVNLWRHRMVRAGHVDPIMARHNQIWLNDQIRRMGGSALRPRVSRVSSDQLRLRRSIKSGVYFVQESGMMAIKIGVAKDVDGRVREMAVGTPHLLVVLAVVNGDRRVEQSLHARFARARIRGEWFRPVPELLAYIEQIRTGVAA